MTEYSRKVSPIRAHPRNPGNAARCGCRGPHQGLHDSHQDARPVASLRRSRAVASLFGVGEAGDSACSDRCTRSLRHRVEPMEGQHPIEALRTDGAKETLGKAAHGARDGVR